MITSKTPKLDLHGEIVAMVEVLVNEFINDNKKIKNEYIDSMKRSYFDSLDKNGLITLLNGMCENELKELLHNIDNDIFIKYVMADGEQPKVRVLSLEDNKNN